MEEGDGVQSSTLTSPLEEAFSSGAWPFCAFSTSCRWDFLFTESELLLVVVVAGFCFWLLVALAAPLPLRVAILMPFWSVVELLRCWAAAWDFFTAVAEAADWDTDCEGGICCWRTFGFARGCGQMCLPAVDFNLPFSTTAFARHQRKKQRQ